MGSSQSSNTDRTNEVTKRGYLIYSTCNATFWAVLVAAVLVFAVLAVAALLISFRDKRYRKLFPEHGESDDDIERVIVRAEKSIEET